MKKSIKKVIDETVNEVADKLSLQEAIIILKEDNKILDSLKKSYDSYYNVNNEITPENWRYFIDTLGIVMKSEEFRKNCKDINCKLYCVKFFTNLKFAIAENAESTLKFELKKYFPQLVSENAEQFIETFFSLPFEFVSLVVRYLANVAYKDKKNDLTPQLKEAQDYFDNMQKRKNTFVTEVNKISLGQSNVFSIYEAQTLLDVKAFYEYNPINIGTLEFLMRLLTNKKSKQALEDEFGRFKVEHMKDQVLNHASYIKYLQDIKEDKDIPFFTTEGTQNKERDTTFDEYIMQYFFPEQYIPTPKEEPVEEPKEPTNEPADNTEAGKEGGEEKEKEEPIKTEQPSAEELK